VGLGPKGGRGDRSAGLLAKKMCVDIALLRFCETVNGPFGRHTFLINTLRRHHFSDTAFIVFRAWHLIFCAKTEFEGQQKSVGVGFKGEEGIQES
jgi:hypothetical protein